jgi:hypothetical protein
MPELVCVVTIDIHKTQTNIGSMSTSRATTALYHIGGASRQLGVSPEHLRALERAGCIPPARRDFNGRVYTEFDIALLRSMGVGQRPRRLKQTEDVVTGAAR